MKAAGD
jgi:hypothetical protein